MGLVPWWFLPRADARVRFRPDLHPAGAGHGRQFGHALVLEHVPRGDLQAGPGSHAGTGPCVMSFSAFSMNCCSRGSAVGVALFGGKLSSPHWKPSEPELKTMAPDFAM